MSTICRLFPDQQVDRSELVRGLENDMKLCFCRFNLSLPQLNMSMKFPLS
jgi:hypothetical protein